MTTAFKERTLAAPEVGKHVLLAIDTALGTSVALGAAGHVWEVSSDDPRGHAEVIGELIARVFELSDVSPAAVTAVVSGIGPGPFTGLRVGLAAAQAFAAGRGVPVLPLQGHEAVALAMLEGDGAPSDHFDTLRVVQDAKRRELFVTDFAGVDSDGAPVRVVEPHLVARAEYEPPAEGAVTPDGVVVREVWPERIPSAQLVQLAARRLAVGRGFEPDRALYLRAPDVKPPTAPKRVSGPRAGTALDRPDSASTAATHGAKRGATP